MLTTHLKESELNGQKIYKTMVDIADLKEDPQNPRDISDDKLNDLVDFLSKYQELKPLLVDARPEKEGQLIGGNQRLKAYKILGWTQAWVELRDPITDAQAFEMGSIDNMAFGQYVESKLELLLKKYQDEIDFSKLAVTLETPPSFEELLKQFSNNKDVKEDEPPAVNDKEPAVSQLGEVYQLGRHRLMCGDATKIEDVEKLMDGQKADMVFTDPPYGVGFKRGMYLSREKQAKGEIYEPIKNDELTGEELTEFIKMCFANLYVVTKSVALYSWAAPMNKGFAILEGIQQAGWNIQSQIVWRKTPFVMGRADYQWQHEICWYGFKEGHQWYGGRDKGTVWDCPKPVSVDLHPTMKPIQLCVTAITNSSKGEDIVLDIFGGSGSTLIACEQTNRTCYMMELDPKYCDVIRKRYSKLIGKENEWQEITKPVDVNSNTQDIQTPEIPAQS